MINKLENQSQWDACLDMLSTQKRKPLGSEALSLGFRAFNTSAGNVNDDTLSQFTGMSNTSPAFLNGPFTSDHSEADLVSDRLAGRNVSPSLMFNSYFQPGKV